MSKRKIIRERRERQRKLQRIIWIIVVTVGAVLLAFGLIVYPTIALNQRKAEVLSDVHARPMADSNAMGDPSAPLKITEYADFQCSHCRDFALETEHLIVDAYVKTGKVYFIYRSPFPGTSREDAIHAAYCAGDQNKFWEYHDLLYLDYGMPITNSFLMSEAQVLDLDMGEFRSCVNSGKYRDRVDQDITGGAADGIEATPTFILTYEVDGETVTKPIVGAVPFVLFEAEIEAALAEMNTQ
ncbi:MAG: DsbA family protein [Anaerolineales bacterium]|nr:DsbA family protein [Anaerolineales bacterium]